MRAADHAGPRARAPRLPLLWLFAALLLVAAVGFRIFRSRMRAQGGEQKQSNMPAAQPTARESLDSLRATAEKSPLDVVARSRYGMALAAAGRSGEALGEFRAAASLAPESPDVHQNLGMYFLRNGKPAQADAEFCRYLEINPGSGPPHYFRGQALEAMHMDMEAVAQYRLAMELAPNFPDSYLALAVQTGEKQPPEQTRALVESYLKLGGKKSVADFVLSRAYRARHQYPEAARYAEMTVQQDPNSYANWHNLGQIYSYAKRFPDADRALKRALDLARDKSTVLIELGMNDQSAGRFKDATESFKKALETSPSSGNIHLYLARNYQRLGDAASAKSEEEAFRKWNRLFNRGHTSQK
jgi:Tfp pilus assembly protein PilF